jgi:hypothetical protein
MIVVFCNNSSQNTKNTVNRLDFAGGFLVTQVSGIRHVVVSQLYVISSLTQYLVRTMNVNRSSAFDRA